MISMEKNKELNSFELQLEVLTGCAFNCAGCHVNKESDARITEKLYTVAYEFLAHMEPFAILIGSTDIFTARNAKVVLTDIRLTELIRKFSRLVVNSTLAKLDEEILALLAALDIPVQVNVVVPETKTLNERYLQAIAKRVERLKETLPDAVVHYQFNVMEDMRLKDYDAVNAMYFHHLGDGVDLNMSFARTSTDPQVYLNMFRQLKGISLKSEVTVDGSNLERHVNHALLKDKMERVIIFYENEFYAYPIVYDDLVQLKELYRINDYADYMAQYDRHVAEQYEYMTCTDECATCEVLPMCVEHKVLSVMKDYGITECVLPRQTILKSSGWA